MSSNNLAREEREERGREKCRAVKQIASLDTHLRDTATNFWMKWSFLVYGAGLFFHTIQIKNQSLSTIFTLDVFSLNFEFLTGENLRPLKFKIAPNLFFFEMRLSELLLNSVQGAHY